ncbi:hypothetical protein ACRALDRAFT_1094130 [Sodiomyces alcalophilus JCM 7366]|uniref:uncharacterized protein n=1 Tax=Sodiomyces alcalophilus JCM 7366 TaxID=591952 RepID=UPI0039B619D1
MHKEMKDQKYDRRWKTGQTIRINSSTQPLSKSEEDLMLRTDTSYSQCAPGRGEEMKESGQGTMTGSALEDPTGQRVPYLCSTLFQDANVSSYLTQELSRLASPLQHKAQAGGKGLRCRLLLDSFTLLTLCEAPEPRFKFRGVTMPYRLSQSGSTRVDDQLTLKVWFMRSNRSAYARLERLLYSMAILQLLTTAESKMDVHKRLDGRFSAEHPLQNKDVNSRAEVDQGIFMHGRLYLCTPNTPDHTLIIMSFVEHLTKRREPGELLIYSPYSSLSTVSANLVLFKNESGCSLSRANHILGPHVCTLYSVVRCDEQTRISCQPNPEAVPGLRIPFLATQDYGQQTSKTTARMRHEHLPRPRFRSPYEPPT